MAVETDADRAIFFDEDDFGVLALVQPDGGEPFGVVGNYDERPVIESPGFRGQNVQGMLGRGANVSGNGPAFRAPTAQLAAAKAGRSSVVIPAMRDATGQIVPAAGATTFNVHDNQPDGTGMSRLRLMKA